MKLLTKSLKEKYQKLDETKQLIDYVKCPTGHKCFLTRCKVVDPKIESFINKCRIC